VGVGRRDITPPVGIRNRNWGAATTDVAEGIHRPFTLTALAIASDDAPTTPLLLVAVDGPNWRRVEDWRSLQDRALAGLGLSAAQLLFNFSHTHSGAVLCAAHVDLSGGEKTPRVLGRPRRCAG
jgi:hypothetical protein